MSRISSIEINNFRSIEYLYLEPENLNAIIGPNSTGKTNVLKALDLVLGEGWTTKAKVARELFKDPNKNISIKIDFGSPVLVPGRNAPMEVNSIELTLSLNPELSASTTYNGGDTAYYLDLFKKECHFIYLPSERSLMNELRVSNWTMLGKLMKLVYENYISHYQYDETSLKEAFKEKMEPAREFLEDDFNADSVTFKKFKDTFEKYCEANSSGLANSFTPSLDIYNLNWFYKTLQIHVEEDFPGKVFDSGEVGAGMQTILMLSIFQTYSELMGGKVIFGIEEPELFLYPQAQRSLYKNFQELSTKSQIFYTTHNPNFIDASRAYEIIPLRKSKDSGTIVLDKNKQYLTKENAEKERFRIYTQFNTSRNELFFANKVLLVEGDSDKILFSTLAEKHWGIDLDKSGISIIECGGKGGVVYFIGICRLVGIENYFAIWDQDDDGDAIEDKHEMLSKTLKEHKGLEIPGNLEAFLSIESGKSNKVEKAYEWASSVEESGIPSEFKTVKDFLSQESFQSSETVQQETDILDKDDLPF